jgi:hypothetical protein
LDGRVYVIIKKGKAGVFPKATGVSEFSIGKCNVSSNNIAQTLVACKSQEVRYKAAHSPRDTGKLAAPGSPESQRLAPPSGEDVEAWLEHTGHSSLKVIEGMYVEEGYSRAHFRTWFHAEIRQFVADRTATTRVPVKSRSGTEPREQEHDQGPLTANKEPQRRVNKTKQPNIVAQPLTQETIRAKVRSGTSFCMWGKDHGIVNGCLMKRWPAAAAVHRVIYTECLQHKGKHLALLSYGDLIARTGYKKTSIYEAVGLLLEERIIHIIEEHCGRRERTYAITEPPPMKWCA